jgi:hypothetical protein
MSMELDLPALVRGAAPPLRGFGLETADVPWL